MRRSPELKTKDSSPSPIKVKDYFANPLHKIKQPAFTQIGFTHSTLNTFVKTFTNRYNNKYIDLASVKAYIKSFTNSNPKLMLMYEDFFTNNFDKKEEGLIETEHFIQFFLRQDQQDFEQLSEKNLKKLFKNLSPLNAQNLYEKAYTMGVPLSKLQAEKIIKMMNYETKEKEVSFETLMEAMLKHVQ